MSTPQPHRTALITDSTSDLPLELVKRYGIIVVPQVLIWGTEELRDNVNITPQEFYSRLATDPAHPTTSQPVAADFVSVLEQAKASGAQEALAICLSDQLSGTLDSAHQAAEMVDMPFQVVNSYSVSMGLGFQVLAAARVREAGGDLSAMMLAASLVRQTASIYFSLNTLEFLHRGGRIGGAAMLVGTALQLKPMLVIDHQTGRVEPGERTRTRKKALQRVYEVFFEHMKANESVHVTVLHGAAPEEAAEMEQRIRAEQNVSELIITTVSPVIGVHTGPGAIGLAGYYEQ